MAKPHPANRSQAATAAGSPTRAPTTSKAQPSNHPAAGRDTEKPRSRWPKSSNTSEKAEVFPRTSERGPVGQTIGNGAEREARERRLAARFERVRALVLQRLPCFATQGAVVARWRTYRGRRLGPYFSVAYRVNGRQRAIYLGSSAALAERVRELLRTLQKPSHEQRALRRLTASARTALRRTKAQLKQHLASVGISLKGWEFRGSRRFVQTRRNLRAVLEALAAAKSSGAIGAAGVPLGASFLTSPKRGV